MLKSPIRTTQATLEELASRAEEHALIRGRLPQTFDTSWRRGVTLSGGSGSGSRSRATSRERPIRDRRGDELARRGERTHGAEGGSSVARPQTIVIGTGSRVAARNRIVVIDRGV